MTKREFCSYVDHSLLKPQLTKEEIIDGLKFARDTHCATVCINPCNLDLAREYLDGTDVKICTVIGFPFGAHTTFSKVAETIDAYAQGAVEIDMVINIGALRNGEYDDVLADIKAVVDATPACIKVILEDSYLTKEQIAMGSQLVEKSGAHYVKTSTGFAESGATLEDIEIMKKNISSKTKIKAAGGITTLEEALAYIKAGCHRIGTSRTKEMIAQLED